VRHYEIWSEGFAATGERGTAMLHGTEEGDSFQDACDKLAKRDSEFAKDYDSKTLAYWGCRLFNNEAAARKEFG
jgi:hypothetical protein